MEEEGTGVSIEADVNGDGKIGAADILHIIQKLSGSRQ
jgi:hypothetical protein